MVLEQWECEWRGQVNRNLQPYTKLFPHAILYDFEAFGDKNYRKEPTASLVLENAHVPISVSVGDMLEREPTHICSSDPRELCRQFVAELERRGANITDQVEKEFMLVDMEFIGNKSSKP